MSRIGVYGGSFNPPHEGHVLAAAELIRLLELDRLLVIPTCLSPHKPQPAGSPDPEQRLALTRLAFAPLERAEVCDLELRRGGVSYTVDTLRTLQAQYPGDELLLTMGTDMLLSFAGWRSPDEIAAMATLCVMHRQTEDAALAAKRQEAAEALQRALGARVRFVENDCIEVSSTELRRMLALGVTDYRLPETVGARIRERGFYQCRADLRGLPFDRLREVSLALHDEKRRPHVLGCCETAEALAERWGADPETARRAGILHDVTKALGPPAQLTLCTRWGQPLTDFEREHPKLLHAKSGAAAARAVFGESDAVCDAICWHTTGQPDMTDLEKILYIADCIEPTRTFPGVEGLRELAFSDLDAALLEMLRRTLRYLELCGQAIDESTLAAWQYLDERSRQTWNS